MAVCGTAKAVPFPFVLDHSSGVGGWPILSE